MEAPLRQWLTIAETARQVGKHEQTIRSWKRLKNIATDKAKVGTMTFVYFPSVKEYLVERGMWKSAYELSPTMDMGSSDDVALP